MSGPTRHQRTELDTYISLLATAAGDLTIEQFRERAVQEAARTEIVVSFLLYIFGTAFIGGLIVAFLLPAVFESRFGWVVVWTLCLGGLGAVSSLLLHVLELTPQKTHQRLEKLHVIGRIFLGCLFSLVLSLALFARPLYEFSRFVADVAAAPDVSVELLFPFLCGYSIRLVLGLLDKLVQTVGMTLGLEESRAGRRPRARRP